ncbi:putative proteasome subunit beta type 7 precursor [Ilyonectria robusta]
MPGFDFSNYNRNAALHARGVPLPKATSTGTTIVGCIFDGGVVVCAPPPILPAYSTPNAELPTES